MAQHWHVRVTGPDHTGHRAQWRGALATSEDAARVETQIEIECGKGTREATYFACRDDCFGSSKR